MRFVYEAVDRGKLATGHTAATEYEIVVFGDPIDPEYESVGSENESLDGTIERDHWNLREEWRVTTDGMTASEEEIFLEFLTSVMAGESFTFDPDSDEAATDVTPLTCMLKSRRFRRNRVSPGRFSYTLDIRVLP